MRFINEIIIHATATKPKWFAGKSVKSKVAEIRRWHVEERGWSDIGYHWIIDRDGAIGVGRPADKMGAHTKGHNKNTLGVSLVGGYGAVANGDFFDSFTKEQEVALLSFLDERQKAAGDTKLKISGHNQYANKACPGFSVPLWLAGKPAKKAREHVGQTSTFKASWLAKIGSLGAPVLGVVQDASVVKLLVLMGFSLLILAALFYIDYERKKKFQRGDI